MIMAKQRIASPDDLLTVQQVAVVANCKPSNIYRAISDGQLHPEPTMLHIRLVIRRSHAEEWANAPREGRYGRRKLVQNPD